MRVVLVNGSPHEHGCTRRALDEVASALAADGIELLLGAEELQRAPAALVIGDAGLGAQVP